MIDFTHSREHPRRLSSEANLFSLSLFFLSALASGLLAPHAARHWG